MQKMYLQKQSEAKNLKDESRKLGKLKDKLHKQYLRKAQEKRFELQVMNEASKIKMEQNLMSKLDNNKKAKND